MEKKTRERKVATAWETTTEEYWETRNLDGWTISFETEEEAQRAEELIQDLNLQKVELETGSNCGDVEVYLVTGFLKYPIETLKPEFGHQIINYSWQLRGLTGPFKGLELEYFDSGTEERMTDFILLDEQTCTQLLNFVANEQ